MFTKSIAAFILFTFFTYAITWGQQTGEGPERNLETNKICLPCGGGVGGVPVCNVTYSTLYVDATRPNDDGSGFSWNSAKKTLQAAINIANHCNIISRINVAKGTYIPSVSTTPVEATRNHTFFIGESYSIYGGYPNGGGTRDYINNPTILNGENQDLYESYHVMAIYGITGSVTIDGFQIKNGFADGTGSIELEPGVTMGKDDGAGIYIKNSENVTIRNCAIYNNVANGNGGGIFNANSNLTILNTVFANNTAINGGGLQNQTGGVANITNCTFGGNIGVTAAGVAYSTTGTTLNVTNSIAWGNVNVWGGGGSRNISFSLIQDGNGNTNGLNIDPEFNNPANLAGVDNKWFTSDDGLSIPFCSPAVNRGNNSATPSPATDIKGEPRKYNVQIDMGAYENQSIPYPLSSAHRSVNADEVENYVWGGVTTFGVPGCRLIANLEPNGGNPVQGKLRAKTFVEAAHDLKYRGLPLLSRHFEFELLPTIENATARVTLFVGNGEFHSYNQRTDIVANMPTADGLNKQHLRIIQFRGKPNGSDGQPGTYQIDGPIMIDPDDADIVWHQPSTTWRVSFKTTYLEGGYFLAATTRYRFIGNGNWNDPANWEVGRVPPEILPSFCDIVIVNGSNCILNIEQRLYKYGQFIVEPNAHLIIQGGLSIDPINPR